METEHFDTVVKGTLLSDLRDVDVREKTIFISNKKYYGSSIGLKQLKTKLPDHIDSLKINKDSEAEVIIETIPHFIPEDNPHVTTINNSLFASSMEYIKVTDFFYISGENNRFKIPYGLTEMHKSTIFSDGTKNEPGKLSLKDLYWYSKAIRTNNLGIYLENCENKEHPFYRCMSDGLVDPSLANSCMLYPQYGLSTLAEYVALSYSTKGVLFCLHEDLKETSDSNGEYAASFEIPEAKICGKKLVERKLKKKRTFVRVILTEFYKLTGNFITYMQHENSLVTVYGINELSKCLPVHHQMLYFVSESEVTDVILNRFHLDGIVMDVEFILNIDLSDYQQSIK